MILSSEVQSLNAFSPRKVTESGIMTFFSDVQPSKACQSIIVTESGIVTLSREVQQPKAQCPISVTDLGIATFLSEVQRKKALLPISVTDSGIVTLSRDEQSSKARFPILVVPSGMMAYAITNLKFFGARILVWLIYPLIIKLFVGHNITGIIMVCILCYFFAFDFFSGASSTILSGNFSGVSTGRRFL